jgi:hypothetical protein
VAAACAAHHGKKHFAERCRKSNSRLGKGAEAENTQLLQDSKTPELIPD